MDMNWFALSSAGYAYCAFRLCSKKSRTEAFIYLAGSVLGLLAFVIALIKA